MRKNEAGNGRAGLVEVGGTGRIEGEGRVSRFAQATSESSAGERHPGASSGGSGQPDSARVGELLPSGESLEEHLSLKRILADVLSLRTSDEHFAPKVQVLKEQAEHHHEEEEEEKLFPKVKNLLNAETDKRNKGGFRQVALERRGAGGESSVR